ncbi:MAG: CHAT domain-containing protein [Chloroflexi bacterium]|nr:MAG: CHAT domain-containing protein [Chloroflexota bacterium]
MQNFDLQAEYDEARDRLSLRVSDSPAGNTKQTIRSEALTGLWPEVSIEALANADWNRLKQVGNTLREIVMPGSVWALWRESTGRAGSDGLRLRIRPADEVAASLPWEAIYDPDRNEFLALNIDTPIVRYLEGPIPQRKELLPASLSVLLTGADSDPKQPLDVVAELDRVEAALQPLTDSGKATVTRIDALRAGKLQTPLMQKKPHILHFAGHGEWDGSQQAGALWLVGDDGYPDRLDTEILATILRGSSVRLVILNACDSAVDSAEFWSGMAQSLVLAGLPAVVAMRYLVSDGGATAFSEIFYTAIAAGEPLDKAMTHARKAMMARRMNGEWLVPALFLRMDDARLWAEPVPPQAAIAQRPGGGTVGGISIGSIQATNVVMGDATFDQRTFNQGGGQREPAADPGSADVRASLQRQIASIEENLLLIEERKSEYVLATDVPMQIVKEERRLRAKLEELRGRLPSLAENLPPNAQKNSPTAGNTTIINTGGGAYIGGGVQVDGGNFIGRDKIE